MRSHSKNRAAEPRPLSSFTHLDPHIDPDTLLVLDVDETLLRPVGFSGSEAWFQDYVIERVRKGSTVDAAVRRGYEAFKEIHSRVRVCPSEKPVPALIRQWKFHGTQMVGLTARGIDMASTTHRQLIEIGIHFDPISVPRQHPLPLQNGVLFSGPWGNKGITLSNYLDTHIAPPFKKLVFVDDRMENLTAVARWMAQRGCSAIQLFWYQPGPTE